MPQFDPPSMLHNPASPNPYQSPIVAPDGSRSRHPANLRCLDIDDPGPNPPSLYGRLKEVISTSKEAAGLRSSEAETLYGTVAKLLDLHCAPNTQMPVRQARALKLFCDELAEATSKHFEAYQRPLCLRRAYVHANAVKSRNPKAYSHTESDHQNSTHHNSPKEHADDRLFLRLSNDNPLRAYSGFALLDYIRSKLGSDKDLIKDVLSTQTEKIMEKKIHEDAVLEKASPWISYRISNVPRSHGSINEKLEHFLVPVTLDSISDAIASAAGAKPVSISPFKDQSGFPDSPNPTWIVRLPEAHIRLPRVLFLFYYRTTTRLWHNSRVCASSPRFRLWGSSQHSELEHASHCADGSGHICPPNCIHCHGPHPADDPKCELRPNPSRAPKTKTQIFIKCQISSEARLRIQADASYIKPTSKKVLNDAMEKNLAAAHNHTIPKSQKHTATPTSPRITCSANLFEVLNKVVEPSADQMEA
ncbi:hypothetical protein EPUL_000842 [Erysiphe pulchra]|uniref:Uncharacterized protein n=1 Tax=Erysiphe pulchra TaxID=225359 RepID=A0A2S4PYI0_9PEZI|nr:hypothetical protein EPUL_000842 [Erysiphe pulchra]